MKRILMVLMVVFLVSTSAYADSGQIYFLWDIPTLTKASTFAAKLDGEKHIGMAIDGKQNGDHYEIRGVGGDTNLRIYGYPASIVLFQKLKTSTDSIPYYAYASVQFQDVSGTDYQTVISDVQVMVDSIYSGLTNKYGKPSSMRIRYNNSLYANSNDSVPFESETKELDATFYSNSHISIGELCDSWKYGKDYTSYLLEITFNNIKFDVSLTNYLSNSGSTTIKTMVVYYNEIVEPLKIGSDSAMQTPPPAYSDTGL